MEIHGGIFVRVNEELDEKITEFIENSSRLKDEINNVILLPEHKFAMLSVYKKSDQSTPSWIDAEEDEEESSLLEISEIFGDLIAFYLVEEYLNYQHWKDGTLLRSFQYSEAGWSNVFGTPDEWEEDCFFSNDMLEKRLNNLKDFDRLTEEREQKIRKVWVEKIIRSDAEEPQVLSDTIVRFMQDHYGLLPLFLESQKAKLPKKQ